MIMNAIAGYARAIAEEPVGATLPSLEQIARIADVVQQKRQENGSKPVMLVIALVHRSTQLCT